MIISKRIIVKNVLRASQLSAALNNTRLASYYRQPTFQLSQFGFRLFSATAKDQASEEESGVRAADEEKVIANIDGVEVHLLKVRAETDIYEESFKNMLKQFCHDFQIPFLENNIPKSCRNAAKIYYRMISDGHVISGKYQKLKDYLASIPQDEISDTFNPYKMKEKWMKFFRTGFSRVLVNTDRALKNDISESLKAFITDQKLSFTDKQFIRALFILHRNGDLRFLKEKDRLINFMMNNILGGKFEFKKGNTLAALAESLLMNYDASFLGLQRPQYDLQNDNKIYHPTTEVFTLGSSIHPSDVYLKIIRVLLKTSPFYKYYFDYYLPQKKTVVISLMAKMRFYDEHLFRDFTQIIDQFINQARQNELNNLLATQITTGNASKQLTALNLQNIEKQLHQVMCTQNPITNQELDRFFEAVEAIEFHAQEQKTRFNKSISGNIRKEQVDLLQSLILEKIKNDQLTLLTPFPSQGKRFNIKLPYLLSPDQKKQYYNEILHTLLKQAEAQKTVLPYAIIRHLRDSIECEFADPKLIVQVLQKTSELLINQYESTYERLLVKEAFIMNIRQQKRPVDETEFIVDSIHQFREAFILFLEQYLKHSEIVKELGGIKPEIYKIYAKMMILNDICETFISLDPSSAAQTELNSHLDQTASVSQNDSVLFSPLLKKRWIALRMLFEDNFIKEAPQDVLPIIVKLKQKYDVLQVLAKLRNQVFITFKTFQKQIYHYNYKLKLDSLIKTGSRNFNYEDADLVRGLGLMRDNLTDNLIGDKSDDKKLLIDQVFQEDQDYKMKLASQYEMLSYVGSDIDEIKMDQLTFIKIFHQLHHIEDSARYDRVVEFDWRQGSLLDKVELSEGGKNNQQQTFLGISPPLTNSYAIKVLSYSDQVKESLKDIVKEGLRLSENGYSGLVSKVIGDTFEVLNDKIVFGAMISDLELYRDIHKLQATLSQSTSSLSSEQAQSQSIDKDYLSQNFKLKAEDVVGIDDSEMYDHEMLRNINKYYFDLYLNESIPYKDSKLPEILQVRSQIQAYVAQFNNIYDDYLDKLAKQSDEPNLMPTYESKPLNIGQYLDYIDVFCTQLFNRFTLDQINSFNALDNNRNQSSQQLLDLLEHDYSQNGKSILEDLGLKNNPQGIKNLNWMLLNSGLVREFAMQKTLENAAGNKKKEYLRYLTDKKGLHSYLQIPGSTLLSMRVYRDIVAFPYNIDYMIESHGQHEAIVLNPSPSSPKGDTQHIQSQAKKLLGDDLKFQELNFDRIKVENLN